MRWMNAVRAAAVVAFLICMAHGARAGFDESTGAIADERWKSGIPLGGIGCGKVELMTDGWFGRATINHNWDLPTGLLKGAFFAVRVADPKNAEARILRLASKDDYSNVRNIAHVTYTGKFPFANVAFSDPAIKAKIELEAFSPLIPYNAEDSSLPIALFMIRITNTSNSPEDISMMMSWPNLLGFGGQAGVVSWSATAGNWQEYTLSAPLAGFRYHTMQSYEGARKNTLGEYFMGAISGHAKNISKVEMYDGSADALPFWNEYEQTGKLPGASASPVSGADNKQPSSAMALSTRIPPGGKQIFNFVVSWHMPHHVTTQEKVKVYDEIVKSTDGAAKAIDGNQGTRWTTGRRMQKGDAFVVDLGSDRALKKVVLYTSGAQRDYPRGLRLETSSDETRWTQRVAWSERETRTADNFGGFAIPVERATCRYVRIVQTGEAKADPWSISELKFYVEEKTADGTVLTKATPSTAYAELVKTDVTTIVEDVGHNYMNRFSNPLEIAKYGLENIKRFRAESSQASRLVEGSNLPNWLKLKMINSAFTMFTNTIYTKDGRFAVLESPVDMSGALGTMDQRMAAHGYYTMFYPELDKKELRLYAKCQRDDGRITHFDGNIHDVIGDPEVDYGITDWPDLSASWIMQVFKEYRWTGDSAFLTEMWPHIKRTMDWFVSQDRDGDNIPEGGSTYDYEAPSPGAFSYSAVAYLGAIESAAESAAVLGDAETEKAYRARLKAVRKSVMNSLWNGKYLIKWRDPQKNESMPNSFIAQLAGDWLARLSGLPRLLNADVIHKANRAIIDMHVKKFRPVPPMEVTPDGKLATEKCFIIQHEPYVGFESIYNGFTDDGLDVVKRIYDVVWTLNREPWCERLYYEAPGGSPRGLIDYMTSPATWHILNALSGISIDVAAGELYISPRAPTAMRSVQMPVFLPTTWLWVDYEPEFKIFEIKVIRNVADTPVTIRTVRADGDSEPVRLPLPFVMEKNAVLNLQPFAAKLKAVGKSLQTSGK